MPFKITCPNGHTMMIRDEHAGRRVRCPTCKTGIVATAPGSVTSPVPPVPPTPPSAPLVMEAVLADDEPPPTRRPTRPETSRQREAPRSLPPRPPRRERDEEPEPEREGGVPFGLIIGGGIAAALLLIGGAGLFLYFIAFAGRDPEKPVLPPPPIEEPRISSGENLAEIGRPSAAGGNRPAFGNTPPSNPAADNPAVPLVPRRETPVARWDFDDDQGDLAMDSSGSGLRGKLVGCKRVPGIRGKAIECTGEGSYFDYGNAPALNFGGDVPISIAFWFRTFDRGGTLLSQRKRSQDAQMIRITFDPFGVGAEVCADQEDSAASTPVPARVNATLKVTDGQWHHLVLLRSGNDLEIYIDGELRAKTTNPLAGGPITTDLRHLGVDSYHLAHGAGGPYPHFKGVIDEFLIYERELSPEEIRKLASR